MSNPIFVFEGVRSATLTASEGSASGYPTTHLQDDRHATLWKGGSTAQNQTLIIQLALARATTDKIIANHNLASLGLTSLDIAVSADGSTYNPSVSLTSFPDPLYSSHTDASVSYIRLTFTKSSALSAAPQIGLLYLGAAALLPLYSNSPERGLQSDAVVAESMSGLRFSSSLRGDRESWKIDFGRLNKLEAYNFMRLVRAVNGTQYPFWFCDIDGNWHFVRFKKNYLPLVAKGNVMFAAKGVEFDEERVGIAMNLPGDYTVPAPA